MSPIGVVVVAAIILVLFQLAIGWRNGRETRHVYTYLQLHPGKQTHRSFTVVVLLERKAETIFPLLDHLYTQKYKNLQIIVVVKQTAGSKAKQALRAYQQQGRRKGLKIIKHRRGLDASKAALLYGTGVYSLVLNPRDRLSGRFFEVTSKVLNTKNPDILAVRSVLRPARTFAYAFWSLTKVFRTIGAAFVPRTLPSEVTITRRKALANITTTQPLVYASSHFYSLKSEDTTPILSWRALLVAIVLGLLPIVAFMMILLVLDETSAYLYTWIGIGAAEVAMLLCLLQVRGYRFIDTLNLVLFAFIAPLYAAFYSVTRLIKSLVSALRHPRLLVQRLPR